MMAGRNTIKDRFYQADTTGNTAILYVNWIKTRNLRGWLWFMRNLPSIRQWMMNTEGLLEFNFSMKSPTSFLIVSYWESHEALMQSYRAPEHVAMMRKTFKHQDDFVLGNETYGAPIHTNYLNEATGYAKSNPQIEGGDFGNPLARLRE